MQESAWTLYGYHTMQSDRHLLGDVTNSNEDIRYYLSRDMRIKQGFARSL